MLLGSAWFIKEIARILLILRRCRNLITSTTDIVIHFKSQLKTCLSLRSDFESVNTECPYDSASKLTSLCITSTSDAPVFVNILYSCACINTYDMRWKIYMLDGGLVSCLHSNEIWCQRNNSYYSVWGLMYCDLLSFQIPLFVPVFVNGMLQLSSTDVWEDHCMINILHYPFSLHRSYDQCLD